VQPNSAVRRFSRIWMASLAVKLVALGLLVYVALKFLGGA
jgi:hypothetical protein